NIEPRKAFLPSAEAIKQDYLSFLLPDLESSYVAQLLKTRKFVVLEGPPGTGKTRMAEELLKNVYNGNGNSIQFHPNTTYETFIGGLMPQATAAAVGFQFLPTPGALWSAAAEAAKNNDKPYLLHIDEIN